MSVKMGTEKTITGMNSQTCDETLPVTMPMSIHQILQATGGELVVSSIGSESLDQQYEYIVCSDSRKAGKHALFVAIKGEHVDGHAYVEAAARLGARLALVEHEVSSAYPIVQIVVSDCVQALGLLAQYNLQCRRASREPFTIVGITGSVGKTTTKDMLSALLRTLGPTVAPVGSFNNEIGLPLTALQVGLRTRFLVAEMGANHVGEIAHLTTIAPPDVSIVLKVGVAHLGEFGSVERIQQAKSEIVKGTVPGGTVVLNADDEHVRAMASLVDRQDPTKPSQLRWFGLHNEVLHAYQLRAYDVRLDALGRPIFQLSECDEQGNQTQHAIHLAISGKHNVMNAMAAINVARYCGMTFEQIASTLANLSHISPHRMQVEHVVCHGVDFTLIDDSFNANPDSMKAGINGLLAYEAKESEQPLRIAVLGAMLELGSNEMDLHRAIGQYAAQQGIHAIVAVGSQDSDHLDALADAIAQGATSVSGCQVVLVHDYKQAEQAVRDLVSQHPSSVVLLKGSHASGLSALAEYWTSFKTEVA